MINKEISDLEKKYYNETFSKIDKVHLSYPQKRSFMLETLKV
jgi:hypothetical protein